MIRFFRKIRQQLAYENNVAKYMRYAIGEIVLVVIGILIALSLNNWNENLKRDKLKQQLFVELRGTIMSDTVSFNYRIKTFKSAHNNAILLKDKILTDAPYSTDLDSSFAKIQLINSPESNYAVFDRIVNVGIEIIEDDNLKNEFLHYYGDSKNFTKYGKDARDLLSKIYPKYFVNHDYGKRAKPEDFEQLKKANEFKIALDYCIKASEELIERTVHRKNLAAKILDMLNNKITLSKTQLEKTPYVRNFENDTVKIN